MSTQKPSIPKGTRDFSPTEMLKRNYIFNTIKKHFVRFGFQPIETPAMENLSTLMGKYGEEGDKLLFKILNSGDYLSNVSEEELKVNNSSKLIQKISEKGLRYDLTVPFARFVVQHQNEINFPFKRYQIQPVWRADRPQKGRYREFFQCDADVIGTNSMLNELEIVQLIDAVFSDLKVDVVIKLNNRKILSGIAEIIGQADKIIEITVAMDKLDKIGLDNVNKELLEKGLAQEAIDQLQPIILLSGNSQEKLASLKTILGKSELGLYGISEIQEIFDYLKMFDLPNKVELDLTLARGLNYYTGTIFEVKAADVQIGSICGGGRYDDLTGVFGLKDVSGVGISFGADRIFDVLNELELYPKQQTENTKVFFINFGKKEELYCLPIIEKLRKSGINSEIYPEAAKMKKQMKYADAKSIPYVVMAGEEEIQNKVLILKNMENGDQQSFSIDQLFEFLTN